ncbi:MAG: glycosyltransferase, partial [Cyanobacteria bacterium J06648_11]
MNQPTVTLIVGPRERFSYARESLESLYADTDYPFELVYVDAGSPNYIRTFLEKKSAEKGFPLLKSDYFISPNQARNTGLRYVLTHKPDTDYVVFVENDVVVKRGWLTELVKCAEETHAAVVGPLTCIGRPEHQVIHNAGGRSYIEVERKPDGRTKRRIRQKAALTGRAIADLPAEQLQRTKTDYAEFHCMLVRLSVFDQTGLLDEGMMATREHIDFCFMVTKVGGEIYSERTAIVTSDTLGIASNKVGLEKTFGKFEIPDFKWSDMPYFMLRWCDAWDLASLHHIRDKWNLAEDKYFRRRYQSIGSRRHEILVKPLVYRLSFGRENPWLESILIALERQINHLVYNRFMRKKMRLTYRKYLNQPDAVPTVEKQA